MVVVDMTKDVIGLAIFACSVMLLGVLGVAYCRRFALALAPVCWLRFLRSLSDIRNLAR